MKPNGFAFQMFQHRGHHIAIVVYGLENDPDAVTLECDDCAEVVIDGTLADKATTPEAIQ